MTIEIRSLREDDIDGAERLRRLAFGTMLGLADPLSFRGDAALLPGRRWAYPDGGFVAVEDGALLGVAMANNWGSLGMFGPVAVHPEQWRRGIARRLLEATRQSFERWDNRVVVLFTFPERISHVQFYQSAGFWPRYLAAIMARTVGTPSPVPEALSLVDNPADRGELVAQCRAVADSVFAGLDLGREIAMIVAHGLGDVILLAENSRIEGFAICHAGRGSEAGSGSVHVKFAAVRPGTNAARRLARLIDACCDFARRRGAAQISTGVNTGRLDAYRLLIELGFRATMNGVAMHRPWADAYDRPDIFALDDWR